MKKIKCSNQRNCVDFPFYTILSYPKMNSSLSGNWLESLVDKAIQMLQKDSVKKKIQILLIQPFLQSIIEMIFPYVLIICVIVGIMIFLMIGILMSIFRIQGKVSAFGESGNPMG